MGTFQLHHSGQLFPQPFKKLLNVLLQNGIFNLHLELEKPEDLDQLGFVKVDCWKNFHMHNYTKYCKI